MKKSALLMLLLLSVFPAYSQKFMTRTAKVAFSSSTPIENIEAINNETACITDLKSGTLTLQLLIKSFKFAKSLMQEHFNENYMESDKFPKSQFKGKIKNPDIINLAKNGNYKLTVEGDLTMHGVTNEILVPATATVKDGVLSVVSSFKVKPEDYKISIPSLVANKIAKEIDISFSAVLTEVK